MSILVESVLSVTFSFVCDQIRVRAMRKIGGDITDEMFQEMIMKKLDDISGKLDGLARKDLLSSVSFLKEGVSLLKISLDATFNTDGEETAKPPKGKKNKDKRKPINVGENFVMSQAFPLAFAQAIGQMKIVSKQRFESALACFKAAREKATEAFGNEALAVEDRVFAAKMRITSRILENLEDSDAAATACRTYLEELHALPGVRGIISVMLDGGMKARFNKTKRLENVKSVTHMNLILFEFTKKFTSIPADLFTWPKIVLSDRIYHPLLGEKRNLMQELFEETPPSFQLLLTEEIEINPYVSTFNSKGDIITETSQSIATVTSNEIRSFGSFPKSEKKATDFSVTSLAVDGDDSVHTITRSKQSDGSFSYKYWVFSPEGKIKQQAQLKFLRGNEGPVSIAVGKDRVIIQNAHGDHVHVCDTKGKLLLDFPLTMPKSSQYVFLDFTDKNDIISARDGGNEVHLYCTKGIFQRRINLPGDYQVKGVAFNHNDGHIVVLALLKELFSLHLFSYSTSDKPKTLRIGLLEDDAIYTTNISSHPKGPIAVIYEHQATFL